MLLLTLLNLLHCNFSMLEAAFKDEPGKGEVFCKKLREALAPFSDALMQVASSSKGCVVLVSVTRVSGREQAAVLVTKGWCCRLHSS